MTRSPDQSTPGKQYELRVTASDLEFDKRLAALSIPETRHRLPGFLHLFSEQTFDVAITDRDIDGNSFTETRFRGFQMKAANYSRSVFSLDGGLKYERLPSDNNEEFRIRVGLQLGAQAASAVLLPAFFSDVDRRSGVVPMYYSVPYPLEPEEMASGLAQMDEYLADRPRGIVDGLTIVEHGARQRSMRLRQRPQPTVPEPVSLDVTD